MGTGTAILIVGGFIIGLIFVVVLIVVALYNGLVRARNEVKEAWAQIDVQLKRRHDLIPNLVETVKGYATHEKDTLEKVVAARNRAVSASGVDDRIQAEQALGGALRGLMVTMEQYPNLKADANFRGLQEELTSTENKIGYARQFYNEQVKGYNTKTETFPANLIAGNFGFKPAPFFEVTDEKERAAPQVKF